MMTQETFKEKWAKVKAAFFGEPTPVVPVAPAASVAPVQLAEPTPTVLKLKDGSEISVVLKEGATTPSAGDAVTKDGAPAPEAEYELEDGSKIAVDAAGMVSVYTPPQPVTQTPEEIEAARIAAEKQEMFKDMPKNKEELEARFAAFATGTVEDQIASMQTMLKAVMQYCFGWEMEKADRDSAVKAAIEAYKGVEALPTQVATASTQLSKHDEAIKGLFEITEQLLESPTTDPGTLTGKKEEDFQSKREARLAAMGDAFKEIKTKTVKNPAAAE